MGSYSTGYGNRSGKVQGRPPRGAEPTVRSRTSDRREEISPIPIADNSGSDPNELLLSLMRQKCRRNLHEEVVNLKLRSETIDTFDSLKD
jgi:hypothetical protein